MPLEGSYKNLNIAPRFKTVADMSTAMNVEDDAAEEEEEEEDIEDEGAGSFMEKKLLERIVNKLVRGEGIISISWRGE